MAAAKMGSKKRKAAAAAAAADKARPARREGAAPPGGKGGRGASAAAARRVKEEEEEEAKRRKIGAEEEEDSSEGEESSSSSSSTSASSASGGVDEFGRRRPTAVARKGKPKGGRAEESESASGGSSDGGSGSSSDGSSDDGSDDDDDDDEAAGSDDAGGERGDFFTDENRDWLKPKKGSGKKKKQQLMSSSDDEGSGANDDDEFDEVPSDEGFEKDSGDEEDDDLLEVERQSRLLDREMEVEEAEAEAELRRTIAQSTSVYHLPTSDELDEDGGGAGAADRVVPPAELRERIDSVLEVLADFRNRREAGRSRSEYVDRLTSDLAELFGYLPELVEHFLSMLGPAETLEFLTASDRPRPLVIRTNTLRTRRKDLASALLKRGVTLDPLAPWSKVGLRISESPVPVGATPEYLAGHYMLQSAASLCPVLALSPQPNERVLDVSAAPGGKTSYLAQLMRNTGTVVANDLKPERQKATIANLHRLGVKNVITCSYDGRKLGHMWPNRFDRVLLDAPCSGLGVVSRDPSVKVQRTMADVYRTVVLQKEMLLSAIDCLSHRKKDGGYIVYSTCSVSVNENEEVVNYVLGKRDVKVVDAGLDFGKPGFTRYQHKRFHPSLALTRRFYPHVHNFDGFFVAKLKKLSDRRPGDDDDKKIATAEDVANADDDADERPVNDEEGSADGSVDVQEKKSARVKVDTKKKNVARKGKHHRTNGGQGAERQSGGKMRGNVSPEPEKKMAGNRSVPPNLRQKEKKKRKSSNAKMTKPRRLKAHT